METINSLAAENLIYYKDTWDCVTVTQGSKSGSVQLRDKHIVRLGRKSAQICTLFKSKGEDILLIFFLS